MNDRLSELLRAADPGTVNRGDPLSERGLRELNEYRAMEAALAHPPRTSPAASRRVRAWRPMRLAVGGAALAVLVLAVFAVVSVLRPSPAVAVTPPLLDVTPVAQTAPELLKEMETLRRNGEDPGNTIREQSWALSTNIVGNDVIESSVVEPRWSETTFLDDGSVRYRVVAAEPFPGQDDDSLPEPGTLLGDETFPPGDWIAPAHEGPPANVDDVAAYMAAWTGEDALTAGQAISEISTFVSVYLLTAEQEAALLGYLSTFDGIEVLGSTTDRLGREGIAFSATDYFPDDFEDRLIISPTTGQMLAVESLYIGTWRTDIASPSVVFYAAWER